MSGPQFVHPMAPAMYNNIVRLHDAAIAANLDDEFLDLLGAFAGAEGHNAKRAAEEAADIYFSDRDDIATGDLDK